VAVAVVGFAVPAGGGGVVGWLLLLLLVRGELGHVRVTAVVGMGWWWLLLVLLMLGAGCSGGRGGGVPFLLLLVHAHQQPDAEGDEAEGGDTADYAAYDGANVGGG
jgi:hypothetical protein